MSVQGIPSIPEIRTATERLSAYDGANTVVRIADFAVKFGHHASPIEVTNLEYLRAYSNVPVPKVFATFTEEETKETFIVMEYIPGLPLSKLWPDLSTSEKHDIELQIKEIVRSLRDIRDEGYYGTPNRGYLGDGAVWEPSPDFDPKNAGPFDTEDQFNAAMIRRLSSLTDPLYTSFLQELVSTTLHGHKPVFTHADFQPKNIMVTRTGSKEDGGGVFKLTFIDWEFSGWYPDYWEFCNATISGRFRPEWTDLCRRILPPCHQEFLMMQHIRRILFY